MMNFVKRWVRRLRTAFHSCAEVLGGRSSPPLAWKTGSVAGGRDVECSDRPMFGEHRSVYESMTAAKVRELLNAVSKRGNWAVLRDATKCLPEVGFLEFPWYGQGATDEVLLAWWRDYVSRNIDHQGMMRDGWLSGIDYGDC